MSEEWVPLGEAARKIVASAKGHEPIESESGSMQLKIRLNSYERAVLAKMRAHYGTSMSGAVRACIRWAAVEIGFSKTQSSLNKQQKGTTVVPSGP